MADILPFRKPPQRSQGKPSKPTILVVVACGIAFVLWNLKDSGFFGSSTGYQAFVVIAGFALAVFLIRKTGA